MPLAELACAEVLLEVPISEVDASRLEAEIRHLEQMLAGTVRPELRPPAAAGKLAQLYLDSVAVEPASGGPSPQERAERPGRALHLAESGLKMVTADDPLYPKLLHVTACALRTVSSPPAGSLGPDGRAARLDRDSWMLSVDPVPQEALDFARQWGDWAWQNENWDEAAEAYEGAAIALNRIVLRTTPDILKRLDLIGRYSHLAPRSAYAHAREERAKEAVTMLERAAYLLSGVGTQRQDLDRLARIGHSDLRDRLIADQKSVNDQAAEPDQYGHLPVGRQQAQARLNATVEQVRAVPGMARFATPAGWADVWEVAQILPVAYLASTDKGTAVLAVQKGAASIATVCHPMTEEDIWAGVQDFFAAEYAQGSSGPSEALIKALECIGALMYPVFQGLGADIPFLLIPLGTLALLPLHAAIQLRTTPTGERVARFPFHLGYIRYASSARSWLRCTENAALTRGSGALVVNNPAPLPVQLDELQLADYERDAVAKYFPVTELAGRDATQDRILQDLPDAAVVHFSCHGTIDARMRYTGVLHIADQRILTVQHLADSPALSARLVVLSACSSGMSAVGVTQMTSIPAALIAAGAAGVIATFWHTDEMATLLLVSRFYDLWQSAPGLEPCVALGRAQEWLAMSTASELRGAVPAAALASSAAKRLTQAADDDKPFMDPWFWTPFFLLGT